MRSQYLHFDFTVLAIAAVTLTTMTIKRAVPVMKNILTHHISRPR